MNHRLVRVSELLKRELGQDLQRNFTFKDVLVAIHEVQVTPDLKSADVFIGVVGAETAGKEVVERLNNERGAIQNRLAKRVVLKYTPRLHFRYDDSVERGVQIVDLIDSLDIPEDGADESADDRDFPAEGTADKHHD